MLTWKRRKEPKEPFSIPPVVPPAEMDEEHRQMLRVAAQMEVQTIVSMRDHVMTEIAASLRWVQASLLLVNGGAAVAVLQDSALSATTRAWSGAFFVLGIVLALFTASVGVTVVQDAPRKMTEALGYWISVAVDLLRVEAIEREWQEYSLRLSRRTRLPRSLGYASLAAFIFGSLVVGISLF